VVPFLGALPVPNAGQWLEIDSTGCEACRGSLQKREPRPWIAINPNQHLTEKPSCKAEHMAAPRPSCKREENPCQRAPSTWRICDEPTRPEWVPVLGLTDECEARVDRQLFPDTSTTGSPLECHTAKGGGVRRPWQLHCMATGHSVLHWTRSRSKARIHEMRYGSNARMHFRLVLRRQRYN
jgi:hypothetical protein